MATAEQVRELVHELLRMSARVVAAEQAASAAATQAAAAQRQQVAQGGATLQGSWTRGRSEGLVRSRAYEKIGKTGASNSKRFFVERTLTQ
eukprot:5969934-Amphidinium_carterae.1